MVHKLTIVKFLEYSIMFLNKVKLEK